MTKAFVSKFRFSPTEEDAKHAKKFYNNIGSIISDW